MVLIHSLLVCDAVSLGEDLQMSGRIAFTVKMSSLILMMATFNASL
jgi:hypothetical protein